MPDESGGTLDVKQPDSFGDRDFDLYNVILDPVNDIFVDAHFVGKSVECQLMFLCIIKDLLIPLRDAVPFSFMESPQIFTLWHDMQSGLIGEKGDLNKKFGIIIKAAIFQVGDGDHGTIGCLMKTAKPVFFSLGGDQFHFLFKGGIPVYVYGDQTAFLFFHKADLGQIHGQQSIHILVMGT